MLSVIWLITISPYKCGARKTGLPEGKQFGKADSTEAVRQYSELYAPVAG